MMTGVLPEFFVSQPLRIVIIGGVAGGMSAATRARRINEHAEIIVLEKDGFVSFANCGLPYYLGGEIVEREKLLVVKPELLRRRFRLDVRTRHEAISIDRDARSVRVLNRDTGEHLDLAYDKLILAPGATPIIPAMPGIDAPNVFSLRNLEDTDRIKAWLDDPQRKLPDVGETSPRRAVVVGAGYIGLEMAEQLTRLGVKVDLVELQPQVLPLLDPEMAHFVETELANKGVTVRVNDSLKSIRTSEGRASAVELSSGAVIETDTVIVGIGVKPNLHLAQQAKLEIGAGGGIAVNEFMQTSDPDIYAVGDVVEYVFAPTGDRMRIALAGPANRSGRIAGEHAASGRSQLAMSPIAGTSVVRVFGTVAGSTGLSEKLASRLKRHVRSVIVAVNHHAGYFPGARMLVLKLVYDPATRKVLGAQCVGPEGVDKRLDVLATAIQLGATLEQLASLDLAYAPPFGSAKDPIHIAAFAALNQVEGVVDFVVPGTDLDGWQVLDVRMDAEVATGMLPGARHIPLDTLRQRLSELDPKRPTLTVCAGGLRAHVAARILAQHGFAQVADLSGGMLLRRHARPDEKLVKPAT